MDDPANEQNRNAGNGGDLVKHTVYLATLDFLLKREPWHQGMRLRECHAGRGIYHVIFDTNRGRCFRVSTQFKPRVKRFCSNAHSAAFCGTWAAGLMWRGMSSSISSGMPDRR